MTQCRGDSCSMTEEVTGLLASASLHLWGWEGFDLPNITKLIP